MRDQDHTKLPEGRDLLLLTAGIIGIGTSGPLIALSAMPIVTLIFWRNLGGAILIAPFALRSWRKVDRTSRGDIVVGMKWSFLAGVALAAHFLLFFASMRLTTVAAGTALTALQPIFAAILVMRLGGYIPRKAWVGMVISFLGVLVITGVDFTLSMRAFMGDLSAIACAALAAVYVILGSRAQEHVATSIYTTICYFTCSIVALFVTLSSRQQIFGFISREWLLLLALIVGAQILGHTMFNLTLPRVSPAIVSLIVFFEVPVSAILAFLWIGQLPSKGTFPGVVLLLLGCAIFVVRNRNQEVSAKSE